MNYPIKFPNIFCVHCSSGPPSKHASAGNKSFYFSTQRPDQAGSFLFTLNYTKSTLQIKRQHIKSS